MLGGCQDFKSGAVRVLVATDIAARGIDVDGVSHVINYELPNVPESYVHRIGRTARAGATGQAIAFCADDERPFLRDIEKLTRIKVDMLPLPTDFRALVSATAAREKAAPPPPREERDPRSMAGRRPGGGGGQGKGRYGSAKPARDPRVVVNPIRSRGPR